MFIHEIYKKIEQTSLLDPSRIAFYEEDATFTYLDFKNAIDSYISLFQELNLVPKQRIGLFLNNSFYSYGLIYACGLFDLTYVPLITDDPAARIEKTIAIAEVRFIFTDVGNQKLLQDSLALVELKSLPEVFILDTKPLFPKKISIGHRKNHLLYMLFTSGSTGTPKGVLITWQGVENFVMWASTYFKIQDNDIFLAHSRLTFDLSVFNIYVPFICCAAVRIIKNKADQIYPGAELKMGATVALFVPRITGLLLQTGQLGTNDYPHLRHLIFCGENLFASQVNAWINTHPSLQVHNIYGPTETTVTCTVESLPRGRPVQDPVAIGTAIPNMQLNFLDGSEQVIQGAFEGELIISGIGVSPLDYCGQASQQFFSHPDLGRSFKTGDLVRRDPNGKFYWLARIDHQVKIRGYRVEISEIEAVLSSQESVLDLVCIFYPREEKLKAIVCFKNNEHTETEIEKLKILAESELPRYMHPQEYILSDSISRNSNGKANRQFIYEKYK